MTNEELALAIQAGHKEHMIVLWSQTQRFIHTMARRYMDELASYRGIELDDLRQAGALALYDAVAGYDPEKGSFLTYLSYQLHQWFGRTAGLRTEKTARDPVTSMISLDDPLEDGGTLADLQPDPHNHMEEVEAEIFRQQLRAALENGMDRLLDTQDAELLKKRYFQGMSRRAVSANMGLTESNVFTREMKALRKLRTRAHLDDYIDTRTEFYARSDFRHTMESPVERIVFRRERLRMEADKHGDAIPEEGQSGRTGAHGPVE